MDQISREPNSLKKPRIIITNRLWSLNIITNFRGSHKDFKPKDLQNIIFPKTKITYFLDVYETEESPTNFYKLSHATRPLSCRGNTLCDLCKQYEENLDHLLFHCPFQTQSRDLVTGWLRLMGGQAFNGQTIIEMTGITSGIENFCYKYI